MSDKIDASYRTLERITGLRHDLPECGADAHTVDTRTAPLARALQLRGAPGRHVLLGFETWMISALGYSPATAKKKRRHAWAARCDYGEQIWNKVLLGHDGDRCKGVNSENYRNDIRLALRDLAEWKLDDPGSEAEDRQEARDIILHLGLDGAEIDRRIALRAAKAGRRRAKPTGSEPLPSPQVVPAPPVPAPPPLAPLAPPEVRLPPPAPSRKREPKPTPTLASLAEKDRLDYVEASVFTGWSVRYLRNLVSADAIPVYGPPRSRRFRRDMLDLFLTNRDLAMRKFRAERDEQNGD